MSHLAPHPWDALGKPPEPGKPYVEPDPAPKAKADAAGFTDSKGRWIDFETGVREAADCIREQGDVGFIQELIRQSLSPDDILEWLVYPESGEFADGIIR